MLIYNLASSTGHTANENRRVRIFLTDKLIIGNKLYRIFSIALLITDYINKEVFMAKIILTVVLLVLILALGVGEQIFMSMSFDALSDKCDYIQTLLVQKRYHDAGVMVSQLKQWWGKRRDILEFTCPNNDIKDIYKEIGELEGTIYSQMYDDSITRTNVIKSMAENSKNLLIYRIKNIL